MGPLLMVSQSFTEMPACGRSCKLLHTDKFDLAIVDDLDHKHPEASASRVLFTLIPDNC